MTVKKLIEIANCKDAEALIMFKIDDGGLGSGLAAQVSHVKIADESEGNMGVYVFESKRGDCHLELMQKCTNVNELSPSRYQMTFPNAKVIINF